MPLLHCKKCSIVSLKNDWHRAIGTDRSSMILVVRFCSNFRFISLASSIHRFCSHISISTSDILAAALGREEQIDKPY